MFKEWRAERKRKKEAEIHRVVNAYVDLVRAGFSGIATNLSKSLEYSLSASEKSLFYTILSERIKELGLVSTTRED